MRGFTSNKDPGRVNIFKFTGSFVMHAAEGNDWRTLCGRDANELESAGILNIADFINDPKSCKKCTRHILD